MIYIFNNLSVIGKFLVILLIIMFIVLITLIVYLCIKNKKENEEMTDTDFFDNLKNQSENNKSVFVDNVNINKVTEELKKIESEKTINPTTTNIDVSKVEISENNNEENKFDISKVTKQMEEDIENNNIDLTEYEVEQEEKAIISYTELLNKVKQNATECKANVQTVELEPKEVVKEEFNYNTEILDFSDLNDNMNDKENTTTLFKQDDIKEMLSIKDIDTTLYSSDEFLKALKELRDSLD